MVTFQNLTQSMHIYSLRFSCSNLMKQNLVLMVREAQEKTCNEKLLWCKATRLECPFCHLSARSWLWHCKRSNSLCAPMFKTYDLCHGEPHKEITWPLTHFPKVSFSPERGFHSLPLAWLLWVYIHCQIKTLLPFCSYGVRLKDLNSEGPHTWQYWHLKAG